MCTNNPTTPTLRWVGRVASAVPILFLLFDSLGKILLLAPVLEGSARLGYSAGTLRWLGALELACTILYAVPRTAVLGAILLTGFLGGATATHVRVEDPLFSHILFPAYVGTLNWGGIFLREDRLRALIPSRS